MKLSVHKSNIEKRERRAVREQMRKDVESLTAAGSVVGYAMVVFASDGTAIATYETGKIMPLWAFPAACEYVVRNAVEVGTAEDFKAPLVKQDRPFK